LTVTDLLNLPVRGAAVALAVLLAAGGAAAQPLSKDPIKFSVGIDAAYSQVFVAQHDKLFEQAGINVDVRQYTQGGDGLDALVAGQVDIGGSAEPTVLIRSLRADLKVLAVMGQSGKYIKLTARPEIADVKQIKKFGIVPGSVSEFSTAKLLGKYGIAPASVEMVKSGPPEFPALLSRGDVDAYFLWEPWPTRGIQLGGKVLLTSGDVGYSYNMWVVTTAGWLAGHQAEAHAALGALAKACAVVAADPNHAAMADQMVAKLPTQSTLDLLKEVECKLRDFVPADIATYKEIADFLVDRKITPTRADVDKVIQVGFYKE
jgi:NitT/TauT family transport system substrate-binding protein